MGRSGSGASPDRDALRRLPRDVQARLADVPRHLRALRLILGATSVERYERAARSSDPDVLTRDVYPLERAVEILDDYMIELAEAGVKALELAPDATGVANLRILAGNGAVGSSCAERLVDVHRARNQLVGRYPHVRARMLFEAAQVLDVEVAAFMRRFVPWIVERFPV